MKILGTICARGGSKGVKNKNISYQNKVLALINLCYLYFYEYTEKAIKRT